MKNKITQNFKNRFTKFIENKIEILILSKCRKIIDDDISFNAGKKLASPPGINDIKEIKFLVWAERDTICDNTKLELKKYLFGYFLKYEQNSISICFKSILQILFYTLILILLTAWIFSLIGIYSKLIVFTVDMLISGLSIYVLYALYDLSYYSKRDQEDIHIYMYNAKIEGVDDINNHLLKYNNYRLDISQYLPVFISGFFVLLITFSFYTSSLINTESLDSQIIYLDKKNRTKVDNGD